MEIRQPISARDVSRQWYLKAMIVGLLLVLLTALSGFIYYRYRVNEEVALIEVEQSHHVQLQSSIIRSDLSHMAYMLAFLRDQFRIHAVMDEAEGLTSFSHDLFTFLSSSSLYHHISLFDRQGRALIRACYNQEGKPYLSEDKELKDIPELVMQSLQKGLYIFPPSLATQQQIILKPYKPVLRFIMPIYNRAGEMLGVLEVEHLLDDMLQHFRSATLPDQSQAMLLDEYGYWLEQPDRSKTWGFMFEERQQDNMEKLDPEVWHQVSSHQQGQFHAQSGLISFTTLYPYEEPAKILNNIDPKLRHINPWKVMTVYPQAAMHTLLDPMQTRVMTTVVSISLLIITLVFYVARIQARREIDISTLLLHDRIFDAAMGGIVIIERRDSEYPVVYCNKGFEKLSGYAKEEVLGHNLLFMRGADSDSKVLAQMMDAIEAGGEWQGVVFVYAKDGSGFWNEITLSPLKGRDGMVSHYVAYQANVTARMEQQQERERLLQKVSELSKQLISARDQERREIARALHDDVGQMITTIQIQTETFVEQCSANQCMQAKATSDRIRQNTVKLLDSVRGALRQLKPGLVEELGLKMAVEELAAQWGREKEIVIAVHAEGDFESMPIEKQTNLYHIVQEALTNIVRHADADCVYIHLHASLSEVRLSITDDGCGFDAWGVYDGLGLIGMRGRVESVGGTMTIDSAPGRGTLLKVKIPDAF